MRSQQTEPFSRRRRALLSLGLAGFAILVLGVAFFRSQVLPSTQYRLTSESNRLRSVPVPAPRGAILDRAGRIVAETLTRYAAVLVTSDSSQAASTLRRMAEVLSLDSTATERVAAQIPGAGGRPVLVASSLTAAQAALLTERGAELPALRLRPRPRRHYPAGAATGHIVGWVGEVSARDTANPQWSGYRAGQQIGRAGLESQYERVLGGTPGERYVQVDAQGRIVGGFPAAEPVPPRPGRDIRVSLDLELQLYVVGEFPDGAAGAVAVIEPASGGVLALYSQPSFDPNLLTDDAKRNVLRRLEAEEGDPLLNRAIAARYPPGRAWQLATAAIGLERGLITAESKMPFPCTGGMSYAGRYFRCTDREGHGDVDLVGAITSTCDVYFYQLGIWLGLSQLTREGSRLGFASATGIDLPGERSGRFPTSPEWYARHLGSEPEATDVLHLATGGGPNAQTPLRMAQLMAALAAGGTAPTPSIGAAMPEAGTGLDLQVPAESLNALQRALATTADGEISAVPSGWVLRGRSAQGRSAEADSSAASWFTGFAGPAGEPAAIAFAILIEDAEGSGRTGEASRLAERIAEYYAAER